MYRLRNNLSLFFISIIWLFFITPAAHAMEIILDNNSPGTVATGTWTPSAGANSYGTQSLYSRDVDATYSYTVQITEPGTYDVNLWWTEYFSRSTKVAVDIKHHDDTTRVYINQKENGGQWNNIGSWYFTEDAIVTIHSDPANNSTNADAVQLVFVNSGEKPEKEFIHGIEIKLGHNTYNFAGPADGENGASDVPGHTWLRIGKHRLIGKHYNTGPFGASDFWSSDAGDGALLYVMDAVIDKWTEVKALQYYMKGYVHYHMLIDTQTGERHPKKVVWFKHVAVKDFEFDGPGPLAFGGIEAYSVTPGIDYKMTPNWDIPYNPRPDQ